MWIFLTTLNDAEYPANEAISNNLKIHDTQKQIHTDIRTEIYYRGSIDAILRNSPVRRLPIRRCRHT